MPSAGKDVEQQELSVTWETAWQYLIKLTLSYHGGPWYLPKWTENLKSHKNSHMDFL
jgi:hypothetical protein